MSNKYSLAESLIKAIIQEHGAKGLAIAINNACAHGEAFLEAGLYLDDDDKLLNKWFQAVEIMLDVGNKIK